MGVNVQTYDELVDESTAIITQAKTLLAGENVNAETHEKVARMIEDAKEKKARSVLVRELDGLVAAKAKEVTPVSAVKTPSGFKSFGEFLHKIWVTQKYGKWDPRLLAKGVYVALPDDPLPTFDMENKGWIEQKDLVESVGTSGGFTVFPEHLSQLFMLSEFQRYVRERALVLPMRSRQVVIPTLDQTGSTAGVANIYGGVLPYWTEEAASKQESEPTFSQMQIIAHKLVTYTEASDELLADSAIGLEALLTRLFGGAIANEEEWTFINGTGAGQPLGIVAAACGVTIRHPREAANAIGINDIFNLLSHFMGTQPVWLAHQSSMPQILSMAGPAGNQSYVWISNARDAAPSTLMGYPIYFIENCATLGSEGDIILADWSKYVIGDRQATQIDSSKHFRFQNDLTAWRAVHRVGGRPWLSAPLTLRDGATEVSPFVILDDAVGS